MLTLGIESATERVGCALGDGGELRAVFEVTGARRHAETLVPAIEAACRAAGVTLADIGCVAADVGPGLFTGLRVGLATARALAHALDVSTVGVSSLELLAHPWQHTGRLIAAAVDARRGEVYWRLFRPLDGHLVALGEPRCAPPSELLEDLRVTDEPMVLVGDGTLRYDEVLADLSDVLWAGAQGAHPTAATLVVLAHERRLHGTVDRRGELDPVYLRAPDVKINWSQRDVNQAGAR